MVMEPADAQPNTTRYLKWLWKVLVFHNLKPYSRLHLFLYFFVSLLLWCCCSTAGCCY